LDNLTTNAALLTPFAPDDTIHHEAIRAMVEYSVGLGNKAFYVCGTTGEGFQMTVAERRAVVETVCEANAGRCKIFVNISHMDFRESCVLADHARDVGADMLSALPPIFNAITTEDLLKYLEGLMDHVSLPFAYYHIPLLSGKALGFDAFKRLSKHPRFKGIKYTSEDTHLLGRLKQLQGGRLPVWSGRDAYFLSNLSMGADGGVGSSFQLIGDLFGAVDEAYRAGDVERARGLQMGINEVHGGFGRYGALQSYKASFELMGIPAGQCRKPFGALPPEADAHLRQNLERLEDIRNQYNIKLPQGSSVAVGLRGAV